VPGIMKNPWLDIPLADYEAHMALPGIEQAQLLSDIFAGALEWFSPKSVAVLGCAGGNGFDRIPASVSRVVGVDINPEYIAKAKARFNGRFANLALIVGDIQDETVAFTPVELIFAGLILEYVNVETVIARTRSLVTAGGWLITALQLPGAESRQVSPSPYSSVQALADSMRLVSPRELKKVAAANSYVQLESRTVVSVGTKQFQVQVFKASRRSTQMTGRMGNRHAGNLRRHS
jgi:SAM-dependent methyltransferase